MLYEMQELDWNESKVCERAFRGECYSAFSTSVYHRKISKEDGGEKEVSVLVNIVTEVLVGFLFCLLGLTR